MQSCFPPCCYRLPVLIPSTSAIHSFLLVSQLLRKPWSTDPPAQPTTLQWCGDTGPSLEVTYQATQCCYHSWLWEKKPQSADISLKQAISRDTLMLTRKVTKWADRKKSFVHWYSNLKLDPDTSWSMKSIQKVSNNSPNHIPSRTSCMDGNAFRQQKEAYSFDHQWSEQMGC